VGSSWAPFFSARVGQEGAEGLTNSRITTRWRRKEREREGRKVKREDWNEKWASTSQKSNPCGGPSPKRQKDEEKKTAETQRKFSKISAGAALDGFSELLPLTVRGLGGCSGMLELWNSGSDENLESMIGK
jgi:hypothetical protein